VRIADNPRAVQPVTVVIGGSRAARDAEIAARVRARAGARVREVRPANWPFVRRLEHAVDTSAPVVLVAREIEQAFPDAQTGGTRFVLTQSTYLLQRWLDIIATHASVTLIGDAREIGLRARAPEAFARRGPWAAVELVHLAPGNAQDDGRDEQETADEPYAALSSAFAASDPADRLARCRRAADARPDDPVVQLALGSALMEVRDLDASQHAIERAVSLASDWEAAHYELGKLHLRRDDLESASRAFAEAGRLMPTFSAAFSNLGATLGELDRSEEALEAFGQALRHDPNGYTILNNVGVVSRELGRLSDSEAAFRKVIALAPEFVFGHYNLGHTLFLQGKYRAALAAYEEGQRRDPEKNARQACRLAVVRLAAGDAEGSLHDLRQSLSGVPAEQKREMLAEAQEILWALLTDRPGLAGWKQVADAVRSELDGL
jgi:tetratricopeptide (TPR) repeat protein